MKLTGQTPTPAATKSNRLQELDCLRGLAALSVVLFHYTAGYGDMIGWQAGTPILRYASARPGVAIFFIISGFVIFYSLQKVGRVGDFAVARVARLFPPYYAAMAITFGAIGLTGFNFRHVAWSDIPSNLAMVSPLFGRAAIDSTYWTLTRELFFYVTIATFTFVAGRNRVLGCLIVWLLASMALNVFLGVTNYYNVDGVRSAVLLIANAQFSYLFVIGIALYKIWSGDRSWLVVAALLLAVVAAGFSEWPSHPRFFLPNVVSTLAYAAIVAFAVLVRPGVMRWSVLGWLGAISYSLYLIHQTLGFMIIHALQQRHVNANLCVLVAAVVVIAVAALLRRCVEVPGRRWVMRCYRSRQSPLFRAGDQSPAAGDPSRPLPL